MDRSPVQTQSFTLAGLMGSFYGVPYTPAGGQLFIAGSFSYSQDFYIMGFEASFSCVTDYTVAATGGLYVPPQAAVVVGPIAPTKQISAPVPYPQAGTPYQKALFFAQAETVYEPATAFAGAVARMKGSTQISVMFPENQYMQVHAQELVNTWLSLPGNDANTYSSLYTTLYVKVQPIDS